MNEGLITKRRGYTSLGVMERQKGPVGVCKSLGLLESQLTLDDASNMTRLVYDRVGRRATTIYRGCRKLMVGLWHPRALRRKQPAKNC